METFKVQWICENIKYQKEKSSSRNKSVEQNIPEYLCKAEASIYPPSGTLSSEMILKLETVGEEKNLSTAAGGLILYVNAFVQDTRLCAERWVKIQLMTSRTQSTRGRQSKR